MRPLSRSGPTLSCHETTIISLRANASRWRNWSDPVMEYFHQVLVKSVEGYGVLMSEVNAGHHIVRRVAGGG